MTDSFDTLLDELAQSSIYEGFRAIKKDISQDDNVYDFENVEKQLNRFSDNKTREIIPELLTDIAELRKDLAE
jgi:hypothetical protein